MKIKLRFILRLLLIVTACIEPAYSQTVQTDLFTFVRIKYSSGRYAYWFRTRFMSDSWEVDGPTSEENFQHGLRTIAQLPVTDYHLSIALTDSQLFSYPFGYMVEVGYLQLSPSEADSLREWCWRGGFLMIDDFHGTAEWENFINEFSKVFPDRSPIPIPSTHPIFHCYYDFATMPRVPGLAALVMGRLYEKDGYDPECWGIFDDNQRLMVLINHNLDIGDSWEHAADAKYPAEFSKIGYKLGVNYIVYALTH